MNYNPLLREKYGLPDREIPSSACDFLALKLTNDMSAVHHVITMCKIYLLNLQQRLINILKNICHLPG